MADWIESYKLLGIEGLKFKRKKKKGLSYEDKCKIVRENQESELTLFQLSAKYQLSSSLIGNWVKLVERNGFEALESRRSRYFQTGEHMVKLLLSPQASQEARQVQGSKRSADTFIKDLIDYIEYYNNERIKLRLNGMSPIQYRKMLTASIV